MEGSSGKLKLEGASRLVLGLSGYTDAGGVASFSSTFIVRRLEARKLGEIEGAGFVLSMSRPIAMIRRGLVEGVRYPKLEVYLASSAGMAVVKGEEPHYSWEAFVDGMVDLVKSSGVKEVYTLGGFIDLREELKASAVVSLPELRSEVEACGVELVDYEGPCSVYTAFIERCAHEGLRAVSLWGHVPYSRYVALTRLRAPDLETSHRTLTALCKLTRLKLPLEELKAEAEKQLSFLEGMKEAEGKRPLKFAGLTY